MRLKARCARPAAPWLAWWCAVAGAALPLEPGVSYFAEEFDATQVPWHPAPERNVEEVFKNHQYYEIVLGADRTTISVIRHRRDGSPERREYRLSPPGGLAPILDVPAERSP